MPTVRSDLSFAVGWHLDDVVLAPAAAVSSGPHLVWLTFVAMFVANLCIVLLGYLETKTTVHLLRIPFRLFAPGVLLLSTIGAYALRNLMLDVWVMFAAGVLGYGLRRTGYSVVGIVLGVILGGLGEAAFVKSMQLLDYHVLGFFGRPVAAVLFLAGLFTIGVNLVRPPRFTTDAAPPFTPEEKRCGTD